MTLTPRGATTLFIVVVGMLSIAAIVLNRYAAQLPNQPDWWGTFLFFIQPAAWAGLYIPIIIVIAIANYICWWWKWKEDN